VTKVWVGEADGAAEGDYVLRPDGDTVEVGRVENGEVCWLTPVPVSVLPDLDDQERLLTAVRGVETAANNRGG
jgi:hypothetical protein